MNTKILFVDDDEHMRSSFYRNFRNRYALDIASGGLEALRAMEDHGPYAVVVADMAMPGMNGIDFMKEAQALAPDTVRIMFTGHTGPVTLLEAINSGQVFRFIPKPCQPEEMTRALDAGLALYRMVTAERELLEATLTGSLEAMSGLLEAMDPEIFSRTRDLADRAALVARRMGDRDAWATTLAAQYSPLWLLPLPDSARAGTIEENLQLTTYADLLVASLGKAAGLVEAIPRLEEVAKTIRFLGKAFNGSGCPDAPLQGEAIPLGARILRALLDFATYEARLGSRRGALEALRLHGDRYDPKVLSAINEEIVSSSLRV